jgi:hypothetical protein
LTFGGERGYSEAVKRRRWQRYASVTSAPMHRAGCIGAPTRHKTVYRQHPAYAFDHHPTIRHESASASAEHQLNITKKKEHHG